MLTLEMIPLPNPQVVGRVLDGEAVLVLPRLGKVKVLNEVGARIWQLCDGSRTIQQIADVIQSEYQADQAEAAADTLAFIADLSSQGVVELR